MQTLLKLQEKILLSLIAFLFIFIPLYPKFPLVNVAGTFVAIRIEDIFIAVTLLLWGIYIITSRKFKSLLSDKLYQAMLLFFFIGAVSSFSAIFLTHSVSPHISILHWARRVELMMLLPVVATVVKSYKQIMIMLITLSFVVMLVNLYALGQHYLNFPVISTTNSEFSKGLILQLTSGARVNSTFAGHYDLATFLAMSLVLSLALFFAVKKVVKIWVVLLGVLSLTVLIMTAARLSFVAAIVGTATALIFLGKRKLILFLVIILTMILIYPSQLRDRLISTVTVNFFNQGQRYQPQTEDQRIRSRLNIPTLAIKTSTDSAQTSTFATPSGETATDIAPGEPVDTTQLGVYRSFSIRLNLEWPRAITAFLKNPFLGTGYSSLGIATDNDLLRSLGEVGVLGTATFGLILIESIKRVFNIFKKGNRFLRYFSAGVLSMILAFLINGLFIDVFEASKVASLFWMILGLNLSSGATPVTWHGINFKNRRIPV